MGRIRVTGRFYLFLAMVAIGLFFIAREFFAFGTSEAIVTVGSTTYSSETDAVVIRDESVAYYEGSGRVVYVADEGEHVVTGQEIAEVYTAKYSETELANLERVRKDIRAYHRIIISNIINDNNLDRLEDNVFAQALELKRLISANTIGNLLNVEKALQQTMVERQDYLRANQRQDPKLNKLYDSEITSKQALESWRTVKKADKDGVVTFYLDGYESLLTLADMPDLSIEDIKSVIAKRPLPEKPGARLRKNIYKIVSTETWYVLLFSNDKAWNPVRGQTYQMQMKGVNGFAFVGIVNEIQKTTDGTLAQVQIDADIGPMINHRSGKIDIGVNLSGFAVPPNAIANEDGQLGVWLSDQSGGGFVPVQVLYQDDRYALVEPLEEGALQRGWRLKLQ